ncbi:hypothetical protein JCM11491_000559, partial [Sporobolomyces phaffii]
MITEASAGLDSNLVTVARLDSLERNAVLAPRGGVLSDWLEHGFPREDSTGECYRLLSSKSVKSQRFIREAAQALGRPLGNSGEWVFARDEHARLVRYYHDADTFLEMFKEEVVNQSFGAPMIKPTELPLVTSRPDLKLDAEEATTYDPIMVDVALFRIRKTLYRFGEGSTPAEIETAMVDYANRARQRPVQLFEHLERLVTKAWHTSSMKVQYELYVELDTLHGFLRKFITKGNCACIGLLAHSLEDNETYSLE